MVVVSRLTKGFVPAHAGRFMVRLHTPEAVELNAVDPFALTLGGGAVASFLETVRRASSAARRLGAGGGGRRRGAGGDEDQDRRLRRWPEWWWRRWRCCCRWTGLRRRRRRARGTLVSGSGTPTSPPTSRQQGLRSLEARGTDGFCTANDWRNGVELGTRFQTSRDVTVVGVRVYRVDPRTITGSLWDGRGTTASPRGRSSRRPRGLAEPDLRPARRHLPRTGPTSRPTTRRRRSTPSSTTTSSAPLGRGPITAVHSTDSVPNGVHCYDVAPCSYPSEGAFPQLHLLGDPALAGPDRGGDAHADLRRRRHRRSASELSPAVHTAAQGAGATRVSRGASVKVTFSEKVRPATLTRNSVRLLPHGARPPRVPVRLTYDGRAQAPHAGPRGCASSAGAGDLPRGRHLEGPRHGRQRPRPGPPGSPGVGTRHLDLPHPLSPRPH